MQMGTKCITTVRFRNIGKLENCFQENLDAEIQNVVIFLCIKKYFISGKALDSETDLVLLLRPRHISGG
jgi:hypothetical protein